MGLKKGGKNILGVRIFLASVLIFFSLLLFVKSADFTATPPSISVNEDASNLYNFTIENTNLTANITQVNITLPQGFLYNGTNGTSSTGIFSNPGFILTNNFSWIDGSMILNGTNQSFWFNATASNPGAYNITITILDSSNIINSTNISVTVNDTTSPSISLFYPQNASYNFVQNQINYSVFDSFALDSCWYSLNGGLTNSTPDLTCSNFTGLISNQGSNMWRVYTNDTSNNLNSSSITFFVDSISPNINIVFPANNSNNSNANIDINYTRSDANLQICWYSNDTFLANTTLASCGNITNVVWSEGKHNVTIYANDSSGNLNFSTISFTVDTVAPGISIIFPTNNTNSSNFDLDINYTFSDNIAFSSCWYSNDSFSVNTTIVCGQNITNINWTDGFHNARIYINDTVNHVNASAISFTIDTILPTLNSSNITGAFFNGTNFVFSPANQDGLYDSINIIMNASELVDWGTTKIYNSSGNQVKFFNGPAGFVTSNIETWIGGFTDTIPPFVPDGIYTINTTITDSAGNNNTLTAITIFIDNSPPAFSNLLIAPNPPNEAQDVQLNVTLTEANLITNVTLEFKGKNYSVSNNSNEYYLTIGEGNYTAHDLINYTWKANDSLGNYNISQQQFIVANRVPSFINGSIPNLTFVENGNTQQINLSFYFNDSDLEDRNSLTFGPISLQNFSTYSISNGVLTLAPSLGYSGITQVAFFANDSFNATYSNTVVINVTPVNHVPRTSLIPNITFNEDIYNVANNTLNLSDYFFDDDGTIASYGTINQNNTGNLSILINNGLVNVTSNLNWNGNASLYFTAMDDDNEFGVSRQIYIIVAPVNDAPQINVPNATIIEDTTGNLNLSNYTTDIDSISSSFVYFVSPENASKLNCSASGSNLTYQPAANFFGVSYCNITASDGISNSSIWRFNISVTNVNDAPNITSSAITNATEGVPYVYQINASDADNLISPGTDNLTYSLTTSPAGMSIGLTTGIIIWLPTNSNVGNNNIVIKVDDGKNLTATQSFVLNVANVNDLPTIPSLISPANQTTLFVNSTTLNWSASSDDENNTIIYYVFFSNGTNPTLNKSTTSTSTTINGLEHNQTYYWNVVSSDGIGNQTKTETRTFNISLKNSPVITQYFPLANITINESNSLEFNVTASDADAGDALAYNWTLNGNSVSNVNNYNFTTNYSSSGTYNITAKVTDSFGLTAERNWRIVVSNNNVPTIISFSPSDLTPVIKVNDSQNFSVFATDPNGDNLTYEWFVDGVLVLTNATSYVYSSNISSVATVTIKVSDAANNSANKAWNITSTSVPVTGGFSGTTTNLSNVNLSSVQNLILENNLGKIFFDGQTINLTGVLDLSDSVFVLNGIAAINSTNYPQLNKKAKITLKGLSYSTIPEIFYSNEFTNNPAQITSVCNFCNITEFAAAPTTNGTVTFEVEHFSSFKVSGSGNKFDFNLFKALERCENGTLGNLTLSINNPDSGDSFEIGSAEEVEINVENADSKDSKNVITEISLYNINDDSVEEEMKSGSAAIKEEDDLDFNFDLDISEEINEEENYLIFAKAYEKGDEETECVQDAVEIKIEKAESKAIIKSAVAKPESATPGDSFEIFVTVENIGTDEENNIYAEIKNEELGILEKSEKFDIPESGREKTHTEIIQAIIPFNAKEGNYEITVSVVSGSEKDEKKIILPVERKEEIKTSQISGSSVIRLEESSKAKYSKNLNAGFIVFLIAGIIILSVLIARRLRG